MNTMSLIESVSINGQDISVVATNSEPMLIQGRIIDSWVEPAGTCDDDSRVILQLIARELPGKLLILEAPIELVPDRDWVIDLAENLCHGMVVSASILPGSNGVYQVDQLSLQI